MRTNIVIDDHLMQAAMVAGNFKTKKDAVEEGLRLLARRKVYQDIRALRGKLHWSLEGDWTQPEHSLQEPTPGELTTLRTASNPKVPQ